MRKHLCRAGVVGLVAVVGLGLAPAAHALYPPDLPRAFCIDGVPNRPNIGEPFGVRGAPGCALTSDGTLTATRVLLDRDRVRARVGAPNGSYQFRVAFPQGTTPGRHRVTVATGGTRFNRFPNVQDPSQPASATREGTLATPGMTMPTLASVAVLGVGAWFIFAPPRHRRRLLLWQGSGKR